MALTHKKRVANNAEKKTLNHIIFKVADDRICPHRIPHVLIDTSVDRGPAGYFRENVECLIDIVPQPLRAADHLLTPLQKNGWLSFIALTDQNAFFSQCNVTPNLACLNLSQITTAKKAMYSVVGCVQINAECFGNFFFRRSTIIALDVVIDKTQNMHFVLFCFSCHTLILPAKGAFCNNFDYFFLKRLDNTRLSGIMITEYGGKLIWRSDDSENAGFSLDMPAPDHSL